MLKKVANISVILLMAVVMVFSFSSCIIDDITGNAFWELKKTSTSPDGDSTLSIYLFNGGATTDFAIKAVAVSKKYNVNREVYYRYHQEDINVEWLDEKTVKISGTSTSPDVYGDFDDVELDITKDSFDSRNE